jgi:hypothetical protein
MFRRAKWYVQDLRREWETQFAILLVNVAESKMVRR